MAEPSNAVFISYRREASWTLVEALYQRLTTAGIDTFYDIESVRAGEFERVILNQIRARPYFLLVLTPGTLERSVEEGDWLRREIETAVAADRIVVPLYTPTFDLASVKRLLPAGLGEKVSAYQAVEVPHKYFKFALQQLIEEYLVPVALDVAPTPPADRARVVSAQQKAARAPRITDEHLSAQELFERAHKERNRGNNDAAEAFFQQAILLNPQLGKAFLDSVDLVGQGGGEDEPRRVSRDPSRSSITRPPTRARTTSPSAATKRLVEGLEHLGYRLGDPYLSETSKTIFYADDVYHRKPRVVLRDGRIRIEKRRNPNTFPAQWELWKSFSLEFEAESALETISRMKGRPKKE